MRYAQVRANPDGSLVVASPEVVGVNILATDAQHGSRGGGTQHSVATTVVSGFESAADKTHLDNLIAGTETAGTFFFGDGADSAVSLGSVAATQEQYQATTFHATGNVTPMAAKNGLVVRATGVITIDGGASINADALIAGGAGGAGGVGNGQTGGIGISVTLANQSQFPSSVTTLAGATGGLGSNGSSGLPGNPGNNFVGGPPQQFQGGRGGAGGGGAGTGTPGLTGGGGGGTAGAQTGGTANFSETKYAQIRWDPLQMPGFISNNTTGVVVASAGSGASGGGGGATTQAPGPPGSTGGAGGAGGAAAGFLYIAAPTITGTGRISANGSAGVDGANGANGNPTNGGGAGGGGGGGGGSGGLVAIKTMSLGGGVTVQANGGSPGAASIGGTGDGTGTNGGAGHVGEAGAAGQVETAILP
jgi:hypothetical protein